MKKITPDYVYLIPVLLFGLFIRLWGIAWGLPLKKAHIDEAVVIFYTMRFFTGDLNPHIFFDYPTLFLYILALVFLAYFFVGRIIGMFASLEHFVGLFLYNDISMLYVIARFISISFAIGSIYLVYKISKENFDKGLLPAFIFSVIPMHVLYSHYATVDISCIFFTLFSFLYIMRYNRNSNTNHLYFGSFILGLAAAVKYYPVIFFIPILVFIYLKENKLSFKKSFMSGITVIMGFITGCPYALFNFTGFITRFIDRFKLIIWSLESTDLSLNLFTPIYNLVNSMTFLLFLGISIGLVLFIIQNRNNKLELVYFLSFPVFYTIFISTWNIKSKHYILPIIPFLIIAGSNGLYSIFKNNPRKWVNICIVLLFCIPAVIKNVNTDILLTHEDTRIKAYNWVKHNLPDGSRILRLPFTPEFSNSDPFYVKVDWEGKMVGTNPDILEKNYDYIIISHFDNENISEWENSLLNKFKPIKQWDYIPLAQFHHPRIIVYGKKT